MDEVIELIDLSDTSYKSKKPDWIRVKAPVIDEYKKRIILLSLIN